MFILIIYNAFLRIQGLTLRYHLHGDDRAGSTSIIVHRCYSANCYRQILRENAIIPYK